MRLNGYLSASPSREWFEFGVCRQGTRIRILSQPTRAEFHIVSIVGIREVSRQTVEKA